MDGFDPAWGLRTSGATSWTVGAYGGFRRGRSTVEVSRIVGSAGKRVERKQRVEEAARILNTKEEAAAAAESLETLPDRVQFSRPIAGYQLVQDKLARMLAEITAMQLMCWRLSKLADEGRIKNAKRIQALGLWRKMLSMLFETGPNAWEPSKPPACC